jgi:hypothetical protein
MGSVKLAVSLSPPAALITSIGTEFIHQRAKTDVVRINNILRK